MVAWSEPRRGGIRKPKATPWESDGGVCFALKGRHRRVVSPFQGSDFCVNISQGVALGYQLFAPSGLPVTGIYPLEKVRKPYFHVRRVVALAHSAFIPSPPYFSGAPVPPLRPARSARIRRASSGASSS